ncbi:diaminopimelate decarboxylase [Candidatus Woesearchaeota archaeon]|nr:diaminopimelate decarboxylase [Candidatus Woesearchaeota archaeon]
MKSEEGGLPFTDHELEQIIREHQTPFYLYIEEIAASQARAVNETYAWTRQYAGHLNHFAVKACPNHFIVKVVTAQDQGTDCSSVPEMELSERIGVVGQKMMLSSNATKRDTFLKGHQLGALINLDDSAHIDMLHQAAGSGGVACFRYNPIINLGDRNMLGDERTKFGSSLERLMEGYEEMKRLGFRRFGMHAMVGSNVLNPEYFHKIAAELFKAVAKVSRKLKVDFEFVNLGGGMGIPYRQHESGYVLPELRRSLDLNEVSQGVHDAYVSLVQRKGLPDLMIRTENGRFITGPAGYFVTKVVHVEKKEGRIYLKVDGNEAQMPRPGFYGTDAYHHATVIGDHGEGTEVYCIAGSLCESMLLAVDRPLPKVRPGATIVFHDAGAHSFAMSFNYNGTPKTAELLLRPDRSILEIRRAQTSRNLYREIPLEKLDSFEPMAV